MIPKLPVTLDDLESWFEHSFRQTIPFLGGLSPLRGLSDMIRPTMDVYERGDEVVVKVELPGLKREISHERFYRAIRLTDYVKKNGLSAKFADGTLTVRIPKSEEAKKESVVIPIQ